MAWGYILYIDIKRKLLVRCTNFNFRHPELIPLCTIDKSIYDIENENNEFKNVTVQEWKRIQKENPINEFKFEKRLNKLLENFEKNNETDSNKMLYALLCIDEKIEDCLKNDTILERCAILERCDLLNTILKDIKNKFSIEDII